WALLARALAPLLTPAVDADPKFVYRWPLADEPLRRLLDERPAHLLTREYASWPEFLRAVLRDTLREIDADPARPGIDAPWGEVNVLAVAHPFASLPVTGGASRRSAAARRTCAADRRRSARTSRAGSAGRAGRAAGKRCRSRRRARSGSRRACRASRRRRSPRRRPRCRP